MFNGFYKLGYYLRGDMRKSELIEALSSESNLSLRTTTSLVNTIIDSMTDALVKGENVGTKRVRQFLN
jgi:nucleoid DNA-binding protein